ncbi:MAG: peptidoglycan DD-metalloendopeptidase family protein [Chitinispirillaceae bacterium]|nr:peptidoglycan DD-metalloendopeptidase family protein [Chitinispirillaceae bacterium]
MVSFVYRQALLLFCIVPCTFATKFTVDFPQQLHIDIEAADSTYLYRFECIDSLYAAIEQFETAYEKYRLQVNVLKHGRVVFRYRDPKMLPLIRSIVRNATVTQVYRVAAINVLGAMRDTIAIPVLTALVDDTNAILAETVINALGKCGNGDVAEMLKGKLKKESNGYLRTTTEAAIRRINGDAPVPYSKPFFHDTVSGYVMNAFLFNPMLSGNNETRFCREYDNIIIQNISSGRCIYPHQQFKMNPKTIFNARTFAYAPLGGSLFHVGEDSGFFLEGLPVHSIADGVVTGIMYEQSWGFRVTVESNLKMHNTVTVIYGHLSKFIDVKLGQKISTGDKIGDIASPESVENGGYFSHLHWGVAKGGYKIAKIYGYDNDTSSYIDPYKLIIDENRDKKIDYKRLLFR